MLNDLIIYTMKDGSLFDIENFGASLCEIVPSIYRIDVGNKSYCLNEDSNEFFKDNNNATEITIHMLGYKNEIKEEKVDL